MKIEQIDIDPNELIGSVVQQLSELSYDENVYIVYYRTFNPTERNMYGAKDSYKIKSLCAIWWFDDDPERRERIAIRLTSEKQCLVRITY